MMTRIDKSLTNSETIAALNALIEDANLKITADALTGLASLEALQTAINNLKTTLETQISQINNMEMVNVDVRPAVGEPGKIYCVPSGGANMFDLSTYVEGVWVPMGQASLDLTAYLLKTGQAADSAKLAGLGVESFARTGHKHVVAEIENFPSLAQVASTGSYADLKDKPAIPALPNLAPVASTGSYNDLTNKPTIPVVPTLAKVATSGKFTDLTDKPVIPAALVAEATPANIKMNGVANAGSLSTYAKGDHVHPVDTSRADAAALELLRAQDQALGLTLSSPVDNAVTGRMKMPRNMLLTYVDVKITDDVGVDAAPTAAVSLQVYRNTTLVATLSVSTTITTYTLPANTTIPKGEFLYCKINGAANGIKNASITCTLKNA